MKKIDIKPLHVTRTLLSLVKGQYIQSPEADLMFAVFRQAVEDYFVPGKQALPDEQRSAERYLFETDLVHLQLLGIDEEWAYELICKTKGRILKLKRELEAA